MKIRDLLAARVKAVADEAAAAADQKAKLEVYNAASEAFNAAGSDHNAKLVALHVAEAALARAIHAAGPVADLTATPPVVYESVDGQTLNVVPVASLDSDVPEDPPVNPPQPAPPPA